MQGQLICSIYAKLYKDLLNDNTVVAIKTSIPTCFFSNMADIAFWRYKDKFFSALPHTACYYVYFCRSESNTML